MNVLILTPDRVGSTLLQRVLTVYANINDHIDPLTVNLHELTNGVVPAYNETFKRTLLSKPKPDADGKSTWGYFQSLETIVANLQNCDHDVTSRLAHYHIKNRKDSLGDQLSFYQYLNDNFFIIATRRQNLFDHALSWGIVGHSKNLNVYSHKQKHEVFAEMARTGVKIEPEVINKYLNQYTEYMDWVDRHFNVNAYFEYERDLPNLEQFVLGLDVFKHRPNPVTWQDKFDIDWNSWNRMHYLLSLVSFDHPFSEEEKQFMKSNIDNYTTARIFIQDMQDAELLTSGIPIKLHTLQEKAQLITNVDQCLLHYNNWVNTTQSPYALAYKPEHLTEIARLENTVWNNSPGKTSLLTYNDIDQVQLNLSDLTFPDHSLDHSN